MKDIRELFRGFLADTEGRSADEVLTDLAEAICKASAALPSDDVVTEAELAYRGPASATWLRRTSKRSEPGHLISDQSCSTPIPVRAEPFSNT